MVTSGCVTPNLLKTGQKVLKCILLCSSLLALTGCVTSSTKIPLAPMPPEVGSLQTNYPQIEFKDFNVASISPRVGQYDLPVVVSSPLVEERQERLSLVKQSEQKECRLKDRFDRKVLLAYEWNRSRVALNIQGLNVGWSGVSGFEGAKLEYKLRIQPEKTHREKCRYTSHWQGLIGSGYNEMFLREDQTVWQELKKVKEETRQFLNETF